MIRYAPGQVRVIGLFWWAEWSEGGGVVIIVVRSDFGFRGGFEEVLYR